jgi:hypothetical protein
MDKVQKASFNNQFPSSLTFSSYSVEKSLVPAWNRSHIPCCDAFDSSEGNGAAGLLTTTLGIEQNGAAQYETLPRCEDWTNQRQTFCLLHSPVSVAGSII